MPVDFQVCSWLVLSALLDDSSTMFTFGWPLARCVHRSLHLQVVFVAEDRWDSRQVSASLKAAFHVRNLSLPTMEPLASNSIADALTHQEWYSASLNKRDERVLECSEFYIVDHCGRVIKARDVVVGPGCISLCPRTDLAPSGQQTVSQLDGLSLGFCGHSEQEALKKACPSASMLHEGSMRVRYIVCTFVERG
jgi:hypothetical protein